jgi:hypothetical protein
MFIGENLFFQSGQHVSAAAGSLINYCKKPFFERLGFVLSIFNIEVPNKP